MSAQPPESSSSAESASPLPLHTQTGRKPLFRRIQTHLSQPIDSASANYISIYACFLTGFTSAPSFSACYVWAGFQTGNVAQLGLALARTFNPSPYNTSGFQKPDQQALTSLLSFLIGTSLGRIGDKIGSKKRVWLCLAAFMQALMVMAGAICARFCGESGIALERGAPSWTSPLGMAALGFISASLGLQGIVGKRVGSPLNTTIVLTTTWVELFNDPLLLSFHPTPSRDIRLAGVYCVFLGAFCARAILATRCGVAGTLGVLAGLRLVQMVWWGFSRGVPAKKDKGEK